MSKFLIFGGTGSLGKKLIERILRTDDTIVYVYSRDEAKHWTIKNDLNQSDRERVKFIVGDIRDEYRVHEAIKNVLPHKIIIAAALKQVDTCELSPLESIKTNTQGTQNVLNAVDNVYNPDLCEKLRPAVLFVSTDKACSPINVYGMCKAISERLVTSKASLNRSIFDISRPRFIAVRYGNVLESRGSIIPLFKYQAENANELTITDPTMTRFVMTLDQSVDLIMDTFKYAESGEIYIPRLPAMNIGDLADIFSEHYNKPTKIIGLRPGEKIDEELINESESIRTIDLANRTNQLTKNLIAIAPSYQTSWYRKSYRYTSSDDVMTKEELKNFLIKLNILDKPLNEFIGLKIEEIKTK